MARAAHADSPGRPDPRMAAPVYVGGLDRSGKTTMSAFLTSHPHIAIPQVGSNMWTYFHAQYGDLADDRNLDRCLADLLAYKHVRFLDPDPGRIRWEFRAGPPTYARLFALFLIHFAERQHKPRWGAQTGLIERYADHLVAAYPGVRIIHMVRDPRDRYEASLARWPDGRGRAGGAVARWRYSTALAERHQRRHPDQYLVVRFEDLVTEPEEILRLVCAFLDEPFHAEMLAMPSAPTHRGRLGAGDVLPADGVVPLSPEFLGRHRTGVPPRELAFMQSQLRRRLLAYGYPVEPVDLSARDRAALALHDWPDQVARMAAWRTVEALQQRLPRLVRRRPGTRMIVEPVAEVAP